MITRRQAVQILTLTGATSVGAGSEPVEQAGPSFTIRSEVRLVLLDVAVKTHQGSFAPSLKRENFRVTENGRPQRITVFANNDVPVTVGLILDESQSMVPKRAELLSAAEILIANSNPKDEIFVLNFNDHVTRGLPDSVMFSDDIQQLRSALQRGVPEGRTALNDAIIAGVQQLNAGRRDKKTLVLISDGGDNASRATRRQMMAEVEQSIATIYTVGLTSPEDSDSDLGLLRQLAKTTGGYAYVPSAATDLRSICEGIAREIRSRYTIGYVPETGPDGALRHIRVFASAPGHAALIARTRIAYRYEPSEHENRN